MLPLDVRGALAASKHMSKDEQTTPPPAAPAKKSRTLLLIVLGVVLLGGGGAGTYWAMRPAAPGDATPAEEEAHEPPAIVNLDPFVVNLADTEGSRFLRVTMGLVVEGEEAAKEFGEDAVNRLKVRSAILEMLAQQTAEDLTTVDGKTRLKAAIAKQSSSDHLKVSDVLFSEFIVQ